MHGLPHELFSSDKEQMGFSLQEAFKHAPTEVHMPLYRVKIDTNIYLQYHIEWQPKAKRNNANLLYFPAWASIAIYLI